MSGVRVLVGTKEAAFVLTSDGKRQKWNVNGPFLRLGDLPHERLSGRPERLGCGRLVRPKSSAAPTTAARPGTSRARPRANRRPPPRGCPRAEATSSSTTPRRRADAPVVRRHPKALGVRRVWHIEPAWRRTPDTVYAGVEDAALFRSTDGGKNWHEIAGLRGHGTGPKWQPGAGGMGLHTIVLDPTNPQRMFIAISAARAFRTDDGGQSWKAINRGLKNPYLPEREFEWASACHRDAQGEAGRVVHAPGRRRVPLR